ncbi:uncharacterized protein LOC124315267 isoform X2 [Daphnia pulicaria]|uniref:uncharacterized protein LOC124315267 isoform X2 n=1 Tax=Daphnia pulicaria TaxID=35523 RepID=UPI001EEBCEC2|nr:uncharacterized protein LOC124315267 isoform X2 [Daphnia pulicaria]
MASVSIEFFRAVSVGSLDDLNEIIGNIGGEMIFNLAQSYNETGETPLLVAISNRHLHVVQFLVGVLEIDISQEGRFSWKDLDYLKIPPLFAAIISDQMSIINYLIETKKVAVNLDLFLSDSPNRHIFELLRQINILELIGAAYILNGDRESLLCGLSYLKKSKYFVPFPVDETMEEAEQIPTKDELIIQRALIVCELVLRQLRLFPNIYILSNFIKHSWMSWISVLQQLNIWWENSASFVSAEAWNFNKTALDHCLSSIRHEQNDFPASTSCILKKLTFVFSFASEHLIRIHSMYWPTNQKDRADNIHDTTKIVCILSVSIMRMLSQKEPDYQQVIRLFLEAGANPNAIDADGNIPLHCLLPKNDFEYWLTNPWDNPNENDNIPVIRSNFIESVRVLLDAGSHVDQLNRRRESVLELLKRNRKKQQSFKASFDSRLDDVIHSVLPLTCYCAQSIQKNNIPVENLPPTLQLFVRNH